MKKKYLIALVPVLAATTLFGCGKNHSIAEIEVKYNNMINDYSVKVNENENKNDMFSLHTLNNKGEIDLKNFSSVIYPTYEGSLNKDANGNRSLNYCINAFNEDATSDAYWITHKKMNQLNTIYQRELSLIFNYYETYKAIFFDQIENLKPKKDELNSLYESLYNLNSQVKNLKNSKDALEEEVNLYTTNSTLINASLESYCYQMNKTIEKALDFVGKFMQMHKTYFFKTYAADQANYNQMFNESLYYTAELVYLNNIKIFNQSNSCNLEALLGIKYKDNGQIASFGNIDVNKFNLTLLQENGKIVFNTIAPITISKNGDEITDVIVKIAQPVVFEKIEDEQITKINNFKNKLDIFKQYYGIYKKSYSELNKTHLVKQFSFETGSLDDLNKDENRAFELYKIVENEKAPEMFIEILNAIK